MSDTVLIFLTPLLATLYPAYADVLGCVSVERTDNKAGALTVLLRNECTSPIAALSLVPSALNLTQQSPTDVDFTAGIGLPDAWAARLPPGTTVGLFTPGSTRSASVTGPDTTAPLQIQVVGVVFANGAELGEATNLRLLKRLWRSRLRECEGLELRVTSLRHTPAGGQDELDSLPYIKDRIKQLRKEKQVPGATQLEVMERTAAEIDLAFFEQIVTKLTSAVANKQLSRAIAQSYFLEMLSSRVNATRSLVSGLN